MWNANFPLGTTSVSGSVAPDPNSQIRNNWKAIEDWWDIDHQTFTSGGSGQHTIGKSGIILVDTNTAITTATSPGTGAISYDITNGQTLIYRSTGWNQLTADKYSRFRIGFTTHSIPTDVWTKITSAGAASGTYDTLSEFTSLTGRFTVLNTGIYLIKASILFPFTLIDYHKGISIGLNGVLWSKATNYGATIRNVDVADILSLITGDYIEIYGYQTYTSAINITNASLHIIRLS